MVTIVSTIMILSESTKLFFQTHPNLMLIMFIGTIASLFAVYAKRLDYPTNFALLGLFTLFESFTIGTIVSFYDKILVIQALLITTVIVVGLTIYTFQTKRDFSPMGASLYALLCVLIAGGFIQVNKILCFPINIIFY